MKLVRSHEFDRDSLKASGCIHHPASFVHDFVYLLFHSVGGRAELYVKPFVVAASARVSVRFEAAEWEISLPSLPSLRFRIII